jgi:hypothetical protein
MLRELDSNLVHPAHFRTGTEVRGGGHLHKDRIGGGSVSGRTWRMSLLYIMVLTLQIGVFRGRLTAIC